ncbi:MAG: selenocysteine-specific translation elongation factor [Acidimicrobiia bacterium]
MPIVGTAGHVDHGKSTLVQALTGRDPDRWAEEKRRGLTIDLGFAWTSLARQEEVGFVDVPGHERFMKNMLAGIEAIDVALLVVAADEGWKPQSEEHLAVLDLLEVTRGVVALTKADRVDPDLLEVVAAEVEERLAGTSLAGSPIIPVAAPSGRGVEEVRSALARAVAGSPAQPDTGRPRLWVDRSFSIAGAGTVATGTLLGGSLGVGDQVALWPGERMARIRGLESHERARRAVAPGNRVAVNLAGLERSEIVRGSMLGLTGQWSESDLLLVDVTTARYLQEPLTERGAFHLHLGSGAWPVRIRLVEGRQLQGTGAALLRLPAPLPVAMGDRFILREVGRRAVVGGGRVLDPAPSSRVGAARPSLVLLRAALGEPADRRAAALLEVRGRASLGNLAAHSGGGRPVGALVAGQTAFSEEAIHTVTERALRITEEFHAGNPLRPGIPKASLASRLGLEPAALEHLVAVSDRLFDQGATIASAEFSGTLGPDEEDAWRQARRRLMEHGLTVPRADQLGLHRELLHNLVRQGRLTRVSDDLVYLPDQLDALPDVLRELPERFTVAEFRDALGLTRKYAVPLLEWLDAAGVTVREGDLRRLRTPGRDPRGAGAAPSR